MFQLGEVTAKWKKSSVILTSLQCLVTTFLKVQDTVADAIHDTAWDEINAAGKEEKRIAIEKSRVDANGISYITVVADGAWSKRSYKVNYNAPSGVVSSC